MLLLYGAARVPPALHRPTAPRLALALAFALCSPSLAAAPAKPDPKASKSVPTKPDPKKPDPKASKSAPTKSDPKKPDPKQPAPKQPDPKPELNQPVPTPPPIPAPGAGGYWLGARLLGPGAVPALAAMSPGTGGDGVIEAIADEQLRDFRLRSERGAICDVGLWRHSRHPNYFGECTFWLGLCLMGLAAEPSQALTSVIGVVVVLALFLGYSIPAAERRAIERRPEFVQHQARVSALVPWPRRG